MLIDVCLYASRHLKTFLKHPSDCSIFKTPTIQKPLTKLLETQKGIFSNFGFLRQNSNDSPGYVRYSLHEPSITFLSLSVQTKIPETYYIYL